MTGEILITIFAIIFMAYIAMSIVDGVLTTKIINQLQERIELLEEHIDFNNAIVKLLLDYLKEKENGPERDD